MPDSVVRPGFQAIAAPRATVFLSNVAIMTAELSAGKLVSPYLGMSLYTWTAIIGVVMGGMALGYHLGGFLADRLRPIRTLAVLFFLAAAGLAGLVPLNHVLGAWPALTDLGSWPARIAGHVVLLYFGPAVFLGAVSPVVARLALGFGAPAGRTMGGLFASGVAGSIAGTFCTGFYLAYVLGVWQIVAVTALVLGILGALHVWAACKLADPKPERVARAAPRIPWAVRMGPNLTVFVSNAGFMMLEIAASRDLGRYFGASLFTWTTIIGVVLAGISIGNYLGGRLADRTASPRTVALLFFFAAAATLGGPPLGETMRDWLATHPRLMGISWPVQILLYTAWTYLLPCLFVGAITPVVVRRALNSGRAAGGTVGAIYAWGALGSILGVFAAGYWLIDWMGTLPLILFIALTFALAAQTYAPRSKTAKIWSAGCAAALLLSMLPFHGAQELARTLRLRPEPNLRIVAEDESQYSYIAVLASEENPQKRELLLDKLTHSKVNLEDPQDLGYEYAWICEALVDQFHAGREPLDALILGGGGYVFPRYLEVTRPGSRIVVAEIDPAVTEMAHKAFGLPEDTTIEVHNMDARNYVADLLRQELREEDKFDCIFGDSISDYTVPQHLTTLEFTQDVHALLREGGFYTITAIDVLASGEFIAALYNTCQQVFRYVYMADTGRLPEERDSFVIVSSDPPLDLGRLAQRIAEKHPYMGRILPAPVVTDLLERTDALLLTDNYAPVENLLTAAVRTRRMANHEIHLARAELLRDEGDLGGALEACAAALEALPGWVDALTLTGLIQLEREDYERAIAALRAALVNTPDPERVRAALADALLATGRRDEARALFEPLLAANAEDTEALHGLAKIALDAGEYDRAIAYWERVLEVHPDSLTAKYNLGLVEAARQNYAAAIEHWLRVLELDPAQEDARHNLALAYLAIGQQESALMQVQELRRRGAKTDPRLEAALARGASPE